VPNTAFQTQFRDETITAFEQTASLLGMTVTKEAVVKGSQATFLVAGSGGEEAVSRGVNGLIPGSEIDLTQSTATLTEWHKLPKISGYNVFASQGNLTGQLQRVAAMAINRKRDSDIITTLNTATQDSGTTATANVNMVMRAITVLGNNEVEFDGNVWGVITPAFKNYLQQATEFSSADYVTMKAFDGGTNWKDQQGFWRWNDVNWIVHTRLPGRGTSAEKCFLFHKNAIGHATNTDTMQAVAGYNEEQDYSFARCSAFMGSVLLQNSGVFVFNHDGSAFVAE
jgi:hypothetical protein